MKRFYGSDYADRINGQLQNTIDSVEDNYFASLNAVYPNSNKALAYKSDALGVARSAQSSIQRIIDKIESVAILLTEFYDYVENTGAAIDVLADDVFDIVTCINTAIGELSDLLNGVGAYKGIEEINKMAKAGNVYVISASPNLQADNDKMIVAIYTIFY